MADGGVIESRDQYSESEGDSKRGKFAFWRDELQASMQARRKWHKQGDKIVKRYLDERRDSNSETKDAIPFRLNLFHSNVSTLQSMLYGNVPKVDVSRRYADPTDDVSRVAGEIMERLLNSDIAENGEEYNAVLRAVLQDRLLPGLGCVRCRYEVETETATTEVVDFETQEVVLQEVERVVSEDAPFDYFHWRDVLWGWGRTWADLPWLAFRSYLTKDEVEERFGEEAAKNIQYSKQMVTQDNKEMADPDTNSPWMKAEIWEIWDKVERKVCYVSLNGPDSVLETKDDPLQLNGFFPCPPFLMANQTTSLYQPVPDFHIAQDLYNEIDKLQTRIAVITEAVKVVGVYDASSTEVKRMMDEGVENDLIPVENWAMFGEKGGIEGSVDWFPLGEVVGALVQLREIRDDTIQLLYQTTGMADILRGADGGQYEAAATSNLKAKFASVRVQALQDQFAAFASAAMSIKAEIISKHFEPESIARRANIDYSFDREIAPQAIQLIKDWQSARLRVKIRPESVAMVDYAQMKAERTEFIQGLSLFLQSAAPLFESDPSAKPTLFQLLQWALSGFKGASEIEGVIDRYIEQSQAQAQQQENQPDPQAAVEQAKAQGEMQKIQAKAQADMQLRQADMQADIQTAMQQHQAKMAEIRADMEAKIAEVQAKMQADISLELVQAQAAMQTNRRQQEGEMEKDVVEANLDADKEIRKSDLKINEILAGASAKMREAEVSAQLKKEESDDSDG